MRLSLSGCVLLVIVLATAFHWARRADSSSSELYEIAKSPGDLARAQAIEVKQQNFLYGPSPTGQTPFFPAGSLGNATILKDVADDLGVFSTQAAAATSISQVCYPP
jgi:hypothetical protein